MYPTLPTPSSPNDPPGHFFRALLILLFLLTLMISIAPKPQRPTYTFDPQNHFNTYRAPKHPGGASRITRYCGQDVSSVFISKHQYRLEREFGQGYFQRVVLPTMSEYLLEVDDTCAAITEPCECVDGCGWSTSADGCVNADTAQTSCQECSALCEAAPVERLISTSALIDPSNIAVTQLGPFTVTTSSTPSSTLLPKQVVPVAFGVASTATTVITPPASKTNPFGPILPIATTVIIPAASKTTTFGPVLPIATSSRSVSQPLSATRSPLPVEKTIEETEESLTAKGKADNGKGKRGKGKNGKGKGKSKVNSDTTLV